jgi:hypothetical protein
VILTLELPAKLRRMYQGFTKMLLELIKSLLALPAVEQLDWIIWVVEVLPAGISIALANLNMKNYKVLSTMPAS